MPTVINNLAHFEFGWKFMVPCAIIIVLALIFLEGSLDEKNESKAFLKLIAGVSLVFAAGVVFFFQYHWGI